MRYYQLTGWLYIDCFGSCFAINLDFYGNDEKNGANVIIVANFTRVNNFII